MAVVDDVFIALGSNLDNPKQQINRALNALQLEPSLDCKRVSALYQSTPLGPQDQPDYINAVAQLCTTLAPDALLGALQAIEYKLGRVREAGGRWGARVIDLDILLYGDLSLKTERLEIPHYDMKRRAFVLYPLLEINPDLCLPCGMTLRQCCAVVPRDGLMCLTEIEEEYI